jgi:hypothetical protein
VSFRFASSGGIAAPGWAVVLVIGCFLLLNGIARQPGHAGPVLNRIEIEMVRSRASRPHAAAFLCGIQNG